MAKMIGVGAESEPAHAEWEAVGADDDVVKLSSRPEAKVTSKRTLTSASATIRSPKRSRTGRGPELSRRRTHSPRLDVARHHQRRDRDRRLAVAIEEDEVARPGPAFVDRLPELEQAARSTSRCTGPRKSTACLADVERGRSLDDRAAAQRADSRSAKPAAATPAPEIKNPRHDESPPPQLELTTAYPR